MGAALDLSDGIAGGGIGFRATEFGESFAPFRTLVFHICVSPPESLEVTWVTSGENMTDMT
jgi:hypothetical protein